MRLIDYQVRAVREVFPIGAKVGEEQMMIPNQNIGGLDVPSGALVETGTAATAILARAEFGDATGLEPSGRRKMEIEFGSESISRAIFPLKQRLDFLAVVDIRFGLGGDLDSVQTTLTQIVLGAEAE